MSSAEMVIDGRSAEVRARVPTRRALRLGATRVLVWLGMYGAALVIFGAFVATRGADPIEMYGSMWDATINSSYGFGQVLNRAAPFILAALAVAVPARAGLINIGGEGQILLGAVAAGGVGLAIGESAGQLETLTLMAIAAVAAGAAWGGLAAALKLKARVDEAVSTLLLNYVAIQVLNYLVYGPWKDAAGNGQPVSRPLAESQRLPTWQGLESHIGVVVGLFVALGVGLALWRTRWGFQLRCVGGNREAARRAGLRVNMLLATAMLAGGALAGLAGMIHFSGMEGQLRPGIAATFGYSAFLASWLAGHHPARVVLAAFLLATIAVAGDSLQISAGLPGAAVNVLMAVVLLVVLSRHRRLAC